MPAFSQTGTYNAPVLVYPTVTGLTISGSSVGSITIPLLLTNYSPPMARTSVNIITGMPFIIPGLAVGGNAVGIGITELPKAHLEGHIDTPLQASGTFQLPFIVLDGIQYTYADLIAGFQDGRLANWGKQNPSAFRDPFGRQYNNVEVIEFTASYVETVPGRTTFTMVLRV